MKKIKIVPTKEKLTAAAGLGTVMEIFDQSGLRDKFIKCLPERVSHRSIGSYKLALSMMCGFIHGFDCLDDFDDLDSEHALQALFDEELPAARTLGDFLRSFDEGHIIALNKFLNEMSWSMLHSLYEQLPKEHKPKYVSIDVDSTDHPQSGNQMEGLGWNYKSNWCLDSQVTFNNMGLCHGFDLRAGNTKSGVGADWLLEQSLSDGKRQRDKKFEGKTFVRADSAYYKQDVIKVFVEKGVLFTLTAHQQTTHWKDLLENEGLNWTPWRFSEKEQLKAANMGKELPEVDLARVHWTPGWSNKDSKKLVFPIIIKRTLDKEKFEEIRRKNNQLRLLNNDGYPGSADKIKKYD